MRRNKITWKETPDGCWDCTSHARSDKNGYPRICINGKQTTIARLFWRELFGEIPHKYFVCHHCDNHDCINPEHLFLGTSADNTKDCVSKNRIAKGSRHSQAKLNEEQVAQIRSIKNKTQRQIAKEFNISQPIINGILNNKIWREEW